jgi:CO/xanthine dehydrogenase FAD-binding subunit
MSQTRVASSINEAVQLLAELANPRLIAGGTDLVNRVPRLDGGPTIMARQTDWVDISSITGDDADVTIFDDVIRIGALATYNTILGSALVREHLPSMIACSIGVGSLQIQARGTLGGNLANASPAGDTWPVLISLGATVTLVSWIGGAHCYRTIAIEDLFVSPGKIAKEQAELIVCVEIPLQKGRLASFHRIGGHTHHIISKVCGALAARVVDGVLRDVRLAFGSVGPTTLRTRRVEMLLEGAKLEVTPEIVAALKDSITPISDVRSTADYRHDAAASVLRLLLARLA